ncbi:MAG: DUF393 domain-containing protein [Bacteroidetes bacterium]|nr:DUF393 domain-containing protein [Bacteroidota bacterium]
MGADNSLNKIVLFDGVCNLCSSSVQFILKRNSKKNLKFASLQSDFGQSQLIKFQLSAEVKTIVYLKGEKAYLRSDAVLEICKELNGLYPILSVYTITPRFARDWIYNVIAKHRYQWFGKKDQCWIPSTEFSERFI